MAFTRKHSAAAAADHDIIVAVKKWILEAESTLLTWEGGGGVVGFGSAMAQ
jgi:hypothetical protein